MGFETGFFLKLHTPSTLAKTNISHVCVNIYIRHTTHFLHQHPRTREEPSLYKLSKSKDIDFFMYTLQTKCGHTQRHTHVSHDFCKIWVRCPHHLHFSLYILFCAVHWTSNSSCNVKTWGFYIDSISKKFTTITTLGIQWLR